MKEKCICEFDRGKLTVGNSMFTLTQEQVESVEKNVCDNMGLSQVFLQVKATIDGVEREYNVWEDLSAIEMPMYEGVFEYPIKGNNYTLRIVKLSAVTDYHDDFVSESNYCMFRGKIAKQSGNIFFLDNPLENESIVFISTAPDYVKATLTVEEGIAKVDTSGHGFVVGKCKTEDSEALVRAWYRRKCKPTELYTMANTWGDYNAYRRVADDFIKEEISAASKLGLDTLQIDDGWQMGNTDDPTIRDEKNRRTFLDGFWNLKVEKFRNGMEEMRDYAAEKKINLGLWFAPDSQHCYTRMERDISVLENAYKHWGMRYFKFDMLYVENMDMYKKFEEMLHKVYSFGDDVFVQLDVTNGIRCGYLGVTQFGRIFAENRYTKLKTYYPHRTLHNLWDICKYIPSFKFQFELVNPTLNAEVYGDDVLAPANYDMDYLFAVTMMSNPLFWMEVQFLPEKQRFELDRVMPVWKEIRNELANSDVVPIGERPDGVAFTGFVAYTPDGKKAYLLGFREVNEDNNYTFGVDKYIKNAKVLASNCNIVYNTEGSKVNVTFAKKRSYALIELEF
jgi:alpha-galactosidase